MSDHIDIAAVADQVLPADSADPQQVSDASNLLAELVRRLNHATRHPESVPTPQDADRLAASLTVAVERLPQLCRQLARRMDEIAKLPGLAADNLGPAPDIGGPGTLAELASWDLADAARVLTGATNALRTVCRNTGRLYIDDTAAPAEEPPLPPQPHLQGP